MSLRDLVVLAAVYGSLPIIPFSPFFGQLVYSWLAYMRPQDLAWGAASDQRLSLWVALAIVAGIVLHSRRERLLAVTPQTVLLLLLLGWIAISEWKAVVPEVGLVSFGQYWKAILFGVLATGLVRTPERFRLTMLVIAGSLGLLACKYAVFGVLRGGARFHDGPGGFMRDNNGFASALVMALPLLVGVALVERRGWLRVAAVSLAACTVLTIVFTFSRGGFLSLAAVAALLVLRSKRRWLVASMLALGLLALLTLTAGSLRQQYLERLSSIHDYQSDRSAVDRIHAWQTALQMAADYPLFGVGPDNFMVVYPRYGDPDEVRVAHSTYLQLLAECGVPGLTLFLALIGVSCWRLERLRRNSAAESWARVWASMLQISLAGYMVASLTLNRATFDLVYHLVGLSAALELACAMGTAQERATELPWYRRPLAPLEAP